MDVLEEDKKSLKKLLTRKRNKRDLLISKHLHHVQEEQKEAREEDARIRESLRGGESQGKNEIWSAKTQEIRDKLTGKKRDAKERWNRFAGTSDGGGRGL